MRRWLGVLGFALVVAVFAVQNAGPVPIRFLWWTAPGVSLAVVILGAALFGALVGALWSWVVGARRRHGTGRPAGPAHVPADGRPG
ncbi:MAG: LapA family protein [Actinomycetia bacterium]|nr:LapA family protein [Actinomycetes bacterium]